MPSIPQRWIPYKACGKVIEGTRIICFKVPLKKSVQVNNQSIKEIWDIPALLKTIPKLGAVVDLTNTNRYYNPEELRAAGILHKKILMPGHILPPENKVKEFMDAIDELLGKDCEFLIGIHCTHGLNRTGYMVCRYMRDRLGVPAKDAIKRFEKARGYQIERENYTADLLGLPPPPPDVGPGAEIRPVVSNGYEINKKPVSDEEQYQDKQRDRIKRPNRYDDFYKNRNGRSKGQKHSGNYNKSNKNDGRSKDNYNSRDRSNSRNSGSSYDYSFDY